MLLKVLGFTLGELLIYDHLYKQCLYHHNVGKLWRVSCSVVHHKNVSTQPAI